MSLTDKTFMGLAVALLMASCQSETEIGSKAGAPMVISAVADGIAMETRTDLAYKYDVLWSSGDKIYVSDGDQGDTFTLTDGQGTVRGTFLQDGGVPFSGQVEGFYPESLVQDAALVWPKNQTEELHVPMYSQKTVTGKAEEFSFLSLGALLQIVLTTKADDVRLNRIELSDGSKPLSGTFTVQDGKAVMTAGDHEGITLDLDQAELSGAARYFHMAVPAGKYDNLQLSFFTNDGRAAAKTSTTMPEILQNTVARISLCIDDFYEFPQTIRLDRSSLRISLGGYYVLIPDVKPKSADLLWSSSNEAVASVDQSGKVTSHAVGNTLITVRTKIGGLMATCDVTVTANEAPEGALNGIFSVSPEKKVYFSKGNLCMRDFCEFQFEAHQYDYQKNWNEYSVGHFYWLSDDDGAALEEYDNGYYDGDLFTNDTQVRDAPSSSFHVGGVTGRFRALTKEEWAYLLSDNESRAGLHACGVSVMGTANCFVLYPDGFKGETVKNGDTTTYASQQGWKAAEEAGVVCLPPSGYRRAGNFSLSGQAGYYWSSSVTKDKDGNCMVFDNLEVLIDAEFPSYGMAIRPVADF